MLVLSVCPIDPQFVHKVMTCKNQEAVACLFWEGVLFNCLLCFTCILEGNWCREVDPFCPECSKSALNKLLIGCWLHESVEAIRPKMAVTPGSTPMQCWLSVYLKMTALNIVLFFASFTAFVGYLIMKKVSIFQCSPVMLLVKSEKIFCTNHCLDTSAWKSSINLHFCILNAFLLTLDVSRDWVSLHLTLQQSKRWVVQK